MLSPNRRRSHADSGTGYLMKLTTSDSIVNGDFIVIFNSHDSLKICSVLDSYLYENKTTFILRPYVEYYTVEHTVNEAYALKGIIYMITNEGLDLYGAMIFKMDADDINRHIYMEHI